MRRRLWFAIVCVTVGLGMLFAAGFASPAESGTQGATKIAGKGGTLRIDSRSDFDFIDPSLAYFSHTFGQLFDIISLTLYHYPDAEGNAGVRPVPYAAAGFPKVSKRGLQWTVTVQKGIRFHTGAAITAKSFAAAMNRNLDPKMQSPATAYMEEIKGAKAVLAGKAKTASGIRVSGNRLIIETIKPVPDMVNRLTMSFFSPQPGPNGLPRNPEGIGAPAGFGGPYYVKEWTPRRSAVLERNPHWRGAITKLRAANVDRIEYTFGLLL